MNFEGHGVMEGHEEGEREGCGWRVLHMYKLQRKKNVPILFAQSVKKSNESATRNQLRNPNMTQYSVAFNTTVKHDAKMLRFMHRTQGGSQTLYF